MSETPPLDLDKLRHICHGAHRYDSYVLAVWLQHALDRLTVLEAERDALAAQVQTLREALEQIQQWAEAYPMTVFREISPEGMKRVATILHEANISMDALHAGWARQIMQGIGQITAAALAPPQGEEA